MKIRVCTKISIPERNRTIPDWDALRHLGHTVDLEDAGRPDAIIGMGVGVMDETLDTYKRYPDVPLFCYNWDCYAWVWENPRPGEYDYRRYGELLSSATEIWVPSECTRVRTHEWWGLDNCVVIRSACPWWYYDDVGDDGYALCCLREIPDPWWGMFEKCCDQVGIPWLCTGHEKTYEEYQRAVARCRFLCSPLYELSTGGLSLLEGYYHGKPCLISDSRWNGARNYFGNRAQYFHHGDEDDFKRNLEAMMRDPPAPTGHREYVTDNFSDERMVSEMLERINAWNG